MDFGTELALWFGEAWRQAGEPSYSLIQAKTGVSRTTINRVREGAPDITEETIEALATQHGPHVGVKHPTQYQGLRIPRIKAQGVTRKQGESGNGADSNQIDSLRLRHGRGTNQKGERGVVNITLA